MASNFQRGSTPKPGDHITSRSFAALADATTGTRAVYGAGTLGLLSGGGAIQIPRIYLTSRQSVLKAALQPGSDVSTHSNPKYTITYGTYGGSVPTISGTGLVPTTASNIITLGASDVAVYMQCDFTYNTSTGIVTIVDAEIMSTSGAVPTSTISGGSGTLYQELFGVTITAPTGGSDPYKVISAPAVSGSQNFLVCLSGPSISGPFLV